MAGGAAWPASRGSVSPSPWIAATRRSPTVEGRAGAGRTARPRSRSQKSPPQRSWFPPTITIGIRRARPGQRGRHVEAAAGNHAGVGEPEVEEVAVDEQAIAQGGNRLEKRQQRLLDGRRRYAEVGVGHDDERMAQHGAKDGPLRPRGNHAPDVTAPHRRASPTSRGRHDGPAVTETLVRVNYSETDQMGVVYHARYLVWLDVARTEHLRRAG